MLRLLCAAVLLSTPALAEKPLTGEALGEQLKQQIKSLKGSEDAGRSELERQRKSGSWDWASYRRSHAAYRTDCEASRRLLNRIIASKSARHSWSPKQQAKFDAEVAATLKKLGELCAKEKLAELLRDRDAVATNFSELNQRTNQMYNMLSSVMKAMNEMRSRATQKVQ